MKTTKPARAARDDAPRVTMFGGKGGVGKTTCAAADGVRIAEAGGRVLLVSTDPAHSLGDALGVRLGARPRRVETRRGALWAVELDADRALARWLGAREGAFRTIASRGTYLDDEDIDALMRLSLPGVDELVGLIELSRLARDAAYDEVVVDTAPTGHTLRLLEMPGALERVAEVLDDMQAKHRFMAEAIGGAYRRDRADRTIESIDEQARRLKSDLGDAARTRFVWVLLPEEMAIAESRDGLDALAKLGVFVGEIRVNRVTPLPERACDACSARASAEQAIVARIARDLGRAPVRVVPASRSEPRGVDALRVFGASVVQAAARASASPPRARAGSHGPTSSHAPPAKPPARSRRSPTWLEAIAPRGRRLVIVGGKGGVGKTTAAAVIALAVAARDEKRRVLLLSADPAHSLADALAMAIGNEARAIPGAPRSLRVRELDARRAFEARRDRYRRGVDELFSSILRGSFDATFDRAVTRDLIDLAPPGLDELFAVLALIDALAGKRPAYDLVVLDTAPTGHTLRLLAMPETALEWVHAVLAILLKYRQIVGLGEQAHDLVVVARDLRELMALLHDSARTLFMPVTRAAAVVRAETERLVRELRRRRIPVGPVVVNRVITAEPRRLCGRCASQARAEAGEIRALARTSRAMLSAPAVYPPPRGAADLAAFGTRWTSP